MARKDRHAAFVVIRVTRAYEEVHVRKGREPMNLRNGSQHRTKEGTVVMLVASSTSREKIAVMDDALTDLYPTGKFDDFRSVYGNVSEVFFKLLLEDVEV